ncbi:MAG: hypothetical protein A2X48_21745 [Lentisphaerae bacterium GWF2_49_21]|nr:MAG: hypothetical protein A2X48_21745 [Lentisphaerae bacterium GWF2_49_21]
MRKFAKVEWKRAWLSLESARQLSKSDPNSAASRAYYAVFHGLTAYFALQGKSFTKHTAIRSALHRDLVNTWILSSECGQTFDFLMDLRETGDYGGITQVTEDNANLAIEKANLFLDSIKAASKGLAAMKFTKK